MANSIVGAGHRLSAFIAFMRSTGKNAGRPTFRSPDPMKCRHVIAPSTRSELPVREVEMLEREPFARGMDCEVWEGEQAKSSREEGGGG